MQTMIQMAATFVATTALLAPQVRRPGEEPSTTTRLTAHADRAALDEIRHQILVVEEEGGSTAHRACNRQQRQVVDFDGRGARFASLRGGWTFGLEIESWGRDSMLVGVDRPLGVEADGRRLEYAWPGGVTEWYVNGDMGVEHGFDLESAPPGEGDLVVALRSNGGLVPTVEKGARSILLVGIDGRGRARYSGLKAFDADGDALPASFQVDDQLIEIHVDDSDADYPITIDPVVQEAYVKASNTDTFDAFGECAISENTIVISAHWEDGGSSGVNGDDSDKTLEYSGAAYVFEKVDGAWTQTAYLKASNPDTYDFFGESVAISGDTIVIGAPREWSSDPTIDGDQSNNLAEAAGAVYVFRRVGSTWQQEAYLKASNAETWDWFGGAVAIDGDTIVATAYAEDGGSSGVGGDQSSNVLLDSGAAFVFERSSGSWSQTAYLKAGNPDEGDTFGWCVAVSGDTIAVGAPWEDSAATGVGGNGLVDLATDSGAVYTFVRAGSTWAPDAYIKASNTDVDDLFGASLALENDTMVVGTHREDGGSIGVGGDDSDNLVTDSGAAYVFERVAGGWEQKAYLKPSNTDAHDWFGSSVDLSDGVLVVGAPYENGGDMVIDGDEQDDSVLNTGAVYVFERLAGSWVQMHYLKAQSGEAQDILGSVVGVSGDTVVAAAPGEDSNATGVNGDPWANLASFSGAAYIFDLGDWDEVRGCTGNPVELHEPSGAARVGGTLPLTIVDRELGFGFAGTYFGVNGVDASGCGTLLGPGQEVLLAGVPAPQLLGVAVVSEGRATQLLGVPANPAIVGIEIALQTVTIDPIGLATKLSNGLEFEIQP